MGVVSRARGDDARLVFPGNRIEMALAVDAQKKTTEASGGKVRPPRAHCTIPELRANVGVRYAEPTVAELRSRNCARTRARKIRLHLRNVCHTDSSDPLSRA